MNKPLKVILLSSLFFTASVNAEVIKNIKESNELARCAANMYGLSKLTVMYNQQSDPNSTAMFNMAPIFLMISAMRAGDTDIVKSIYIDEKNNLENNAFKSIDESGSRSNIKQYLDTYLSPKVLKCNQMAKSVKFKQSTQDFDLFLKNKSNLESFKPFAQWVQKDMNSQKESRRVNSVIASPD